MLKLEIAPADNQCMCVVFCQVTFDGGTGSFDAQF